MPATYHLSHLRTLEAEAVHVMREAAAEFERPVLCCLAVARTRSCCCAWRRRRFARGPFPFPVMHVDTGHNFPEVIEFRDRRMAEIDKASDRRFGARTRSGWAGCG